MSRGARRAGVAPGAGALALASIAAMGGAAAQETGPGDGSEAPGRLALLVGIDVYSPEANERRPHALLGAKNDVERVRRLLFERFAFDPADVRVLLDGEATHERLVREFRDWLIERAGPRTEVLFWYSGHGSRCPDAEHEGPPEPSGCDSTLVAYDSRVAGRAGGYDLTDDELHSLLRALCAKTERVTVVTDSCHSGGVSRGSGDGLAGLPSRFTPAFEAPLPFAAIEPFWPADVPFLEDGDPRRDEPLPLVHLAACAFDEAANEHALQLADGSRLVHGAFSCFLIQALEQAEPGVTYRQLGRRVSARLGSLYRQQAVQAEGALDRKLFDAAFAPPPPGHDGEIAPRSRLVQVFAGSLQFLREGSELEVRDDGGALLGQALVRRILPTRAIAELQGDPPAVERPTPVRVIETARPRGAAPLLVFVPEGARFDELVALLERSERPPVAVTRDPTEPAAVDLIGTGEGAPLELRTRPDGAVRFRSPLEMVVESSAGVCPGDGLTDAGLGDSDPWTKLTALLAEELRFRELLTLGALDGGIRLSIEIRATEFRGAGPAPEGRKPQRPAIVSTGSRRSDAASGSGVGITRIHVAKDDPSAADVVDLVIQVDPDRRARDVHLSVLCVSEDRSVALLYPKSEGDRTNAIAPGKPLRITIRVFPTVVEGISRPTVDRFLAIATERPADFSRFESSPGVFLPADAEMKGPPRGGPVGSGLPDLLADALLPTHRGVGVISPVDESFGVATIDAQVIAAPASAGTGDRRYFEDFEFLEATVAKDYDALDSKRIDWDAVVKEMRPRFQECEDDVTHVRNVMALLATLRDSHTGVLDTKVDRGALPGKFDGLYGGGLWMGYDDGKFVLRGLMQGHSLAGVLPLGSVLVAVGGEPAWLALERDRRRVAAFQGMSTRHSHFASLSNKLFPFGESQQVDAVLLLPDRKTRKVTLERWGPGGRSFDFVGAFLPDGVTSAGGAVSAMLATGWSKKVGFLKVTGGMDGDTVRAFHAAFDALKGMEALLLDCRSMGGGSDDSAWEMCGRLFEKGVSNGRHGTLSPSGSWQFGGPVVMLQDEVEVSSAETFTWAASETGRVVSVGRPTGGWGIIPRRYSLPSGLAEFRLGVNDRPTPIRGIHTEGIGWPADMTIPFGPEVCALAGEKDDPHPDPAMEVGMAALRAMHAGMATDATREAFRALAEGDVAAFKAFAKKVAAKDKGFEGDDLARIFAKDLEAEIELEIAALALEDEMLPDWLGASRRLPRLMARAKAAGLGAGAAKLEKLVKGAKAEVAAQEALLAMPDPGFAADDAARKSWLAKHGSTKTGRYVKDRLWR